MLKPRLRWCARTRAAFGDPNDFLVSLNDGHRRPDRVVSGNQSALICRGSPPSPVEAPATPVKRDKKNLPPLRLV